MTDREPSLVDRINQHINEKSDLPRARPMPAMPSPGRKRAEAETPEATPPVEAAPASAAPPAPPAEPAAPKRREVSVNWDTDGKVTPADEAPLELSEEAPADADDQPAITAPDTSDAEIAASAAELREKFKDSKIFGKAVDKVMHERMHGRDETPGKSGDFIEIAAPEELKKKTVKPPGVGMTPTQMAEKGDAGMARQGENYEDKLAQQLAELQRIIEAHAKGKLKDTDTARQLHDLCFAIKSEAGSFDYPLITWIAENLHAYLGRQHEFGKMQTEISLIHITAMRKVLRDKMKGDGGKDGNQLLNELTALVYKKKARNR